jgi:hypothetical protein
MIRQTRKYAAHAAVFFLATLLFNCEVEGAGVKPLEVFTERIVALEVERFANEHSISEALVRNSLDRLNKGMNIMSQERTVASLRLLADARQAVADAERSGKALSDYINSSRPQLKEGGHERFLPLAGLYERIEKPYHAALERFLATAADFVQYCSENHVAISTGQVVENSRYDALYAAYLRDMEAFNLQSMNRSQLIADWASEHPAIMELLPR